MATNLDSWLDKFIFPNAEEQEEEELVIEEEPQEEARPTEDLQSFVDKFEFPNAEPEPVYEQERAATPEVPDSALGNMGNAFLQGVTETGVGAARGLYTQGVVGAAEQKARVIGGQPVVVDTTPEIEEVQEEDIINCDVYRWAEEVIQRRREQSPVDEDFANSFLGHASRGAGSLAVFLATGIAGPQSTLIAGMGANADAQFQDALRSGADFDDALEALAVGGAIGTTEALPVLGMFRRLDKATGNWFSKAVSKKVLEKLDVAENATRAVAKVGVEATSGAVEEALQETFVEFMNNWTARDLVGYDEDRELLEGVQRSGEVGGVLGFLTNAAMTTLGLGRRGAVNYAHERAQTARLDADLRSRAMTEATQALSPDRAQEYIAPPAPIDERVAPAPDISRVGGEIEEVNLGDLQSANDPEYINSDLASAGDLARKKVRGELVGMEAGRAEREMREVTRRLAEEAENKVISFPQQEQQEETTLYRGLKEDGTPRGYPGTFYTEDADLAANYARTSTSEGEVQERKFTPQKTFDVDEVSQWDQAKKDELKQKVQTFFEERGVPVEDGYLWDVLENGETDFIYPTKEDADFLKQEGYDNVRFENEGGQRVATRFVLEEEAQGLDTPGRKTLYRGAYGSTADNVVIGDLGAHFSPNPAVADSIVQRGGEVGEFQAEIEKPLRVDREPRNGTWHDPMEVIAVLEEAGMTIPSNVRGLARTARMSNEDLLSGENVQPRHRKALDAIVAHLQSEGYDSIVYNNEFEGGGDSIILFDPTKAEQAPDNVVELPQRDATELDPIAREEAFDEASIKVARGEMTVEEAQRQFPERARELEKPIEDVVQEAPQEATEAAAEQEEQPLIPQPLPPVEQDLPAPPRGPQPPSTPPSNPTDDPGYIGGVIKNLAETGGMQEVNLDTPGIQMWTSPKTGKHFIRLEDGKTLPLDGGEVLAIQAASKGWPGAVRDFISDKLNTRGRRTKRFVFGLAQGLKQAMAGAHRQIQDNTAILEQQWIRRHGGQRITDAPKKQLRSIEDYLAGHITRDELKSLTDMDGAFTDALDNIRTNIDKLSRIMINENMVPAELQVKIAENLGTYLRTEYVMKSFLENNKAAADSLAAIPDAARNKVTQALLYAYQKPVSAPDGEILPRAVLRRMARIYGLTGHKVVGPAFTVDPDTGETKVTQESEVLRGTDLQLSYAPREELQDKLREIIAREKIPADDVMLRFLQSGGDVISSAQKGRDKSVERKRMIGRSAEELRQDGFTEEEIELNEAIREMLGEIHDPVTKQADTLAAMMNTIVTTRMINELAKMSHVGATSIARPNSETGADQRLVPKGSAWGDILMTVPETGEVVKASELYVRPEIKSAFERLITPKYMNWGGWYNYLVRIPQAATKIGMTALSYGSHPRNARTAAEIMVGRGYLLNLTNPARTIRALGAASKLSARSAAVGTKGDPKADQDAANRYLAKLGIFHDSVRVGSIKELTERYMASDNAVDAFGQNTYMNIQGQSIGQNFSEISRARKARKAAKQVADKVHPNLKKGVKQALLDAPMSFFRLEDEGFKLSMFMQEREILAWMQGREDLLEVMRGERQGTEGEYSAIRELDLKAAQKIRDKVPTYSNVPESIKDLSANLFFTPFPSFSSEMIRNTYHDWADLIEMARYASGAEGKNYEGYYAGADRNKVRARLAERTMAIGVMASYYTAQLTTLGAAVGVIGLGAEPDEEDEITKKARALTKTLEDDPNAKLVPGEYDVLDPFFRKIVPGWGQSNMYKVANFEPGKSLTLVDMNFTNPYAQMIGAGANGWSALTSLYEGDYEQAERFAVQGVANFAADWMSEEPAFKAFKEAFITGEDQWGREFDDWQDRSAHLLKVITPYAQTAKVAERVLFMDEDDPKAQTMLDFAIGERPFKLDFENVYVNTIWPSVIQMQESNMKLRKKVRAFAKGEASAEDVRRAAANNEDVRIEEMHKLAQNDMATDVLGMSRLQKRRLIKRSPLSGVNEIDVKDLQSGRYSKARYRYKDFYNKNERLNGETSRKFREAVKLIEEVQYEMGL